MTDGSYSVGVSLGWEIDLFGRLRSLRHAALEQYFASMEGRRAAQILLISQVADQYLTMLAFDDLLNVTERTLDAARASYNIVKLQFDNARGRSWICGKPKPWSNRHRQIARRSCARARRRRMDWYCCSSSRCPPR